MRVVLASCFYGARAPGSTLLSNWVGMMKPVLYNQTILDISFPGSHDSITYDLSTVFSGHANDIPPSLAWILHNFGSLVPTVGAFGRSQAKTQGLSITDQLDSGIRFIDFRIQYTSSKPFLEDSTFYCLHFMQSNKPAIEYLKEARAWLYEHPDEIVIFWISKHGSQCAEQGYAATVEQRRKWWQEVESVFEGILIDRVKTPINETTVGHLIDNTESRVLMYVADYQNMTSNSPHATDSCYIDNRLDGGVNDEANAYARQMSQFNSSRADKAQLKKKNTFLLMSMATSAGTELIKDSFLIHYFQSQKSLLNCAKYLNLPNVTKYCTTTLQALSQLSNYYNQMSLEAAHVKGYEFPNAIYIGAIDFNGTIRTGTNVFRSTEDSFQGSNGHGTTKYAYVSTVLLGNLRRVCPGNDKSIMFIDPQFSKDCEFLKSKLNANRALFPLQTWKDLDTGRLADWPMQAT